MKLERTWLVWGSQCGWGVEYEKGVGREQVEEAERCQIT